MIDGTDRGSVPRRVDGLVAGAHAVEVRIAGRPPLSQIVQIRAGEIAQVSVGGGGAMSVGGDILGSRWQESENGWSGAWTRRANGNLFDVVWTRGAEHLQNVVTVTADGNTIQAERHDPGGAHVLYVGHAGPDHATISGIGAVSGEPTYEWRATITQRGASDVAGTRWEETENGWNGDWTRRADSNVFDVVWTRGGERVQNAVNVTVDGNTIQVERHDPGGAHVLYLGHVGPDGTTITGVGMASASPFFDWNATVSR